MDLDIDDILADIHASDPSSPASAALDHQQLTRFWISERACPEILPWPAELMDRVMQRVRTQIEKIEDMTARVGIGEDTRSSGNQNLNLTLSILQTDLSRTQFMLRSLLRQRLAKLTTYAMYYLTGLSADTKSSLLSLQEQSFLQNHQALLSEFYGASFLGFFPPQLRKLDDNVGGVNMVEGPDGKKAVYVRCLAQTWSNDPGLDGYGEDTGGVTLNMKRGEVWVVRWEDIRKGITDGALELL